MKSGGPFAPAFAARKAHLSIKFHAENPPPSLSPERAKVARFCSARSRTIPPLPWQTFALPCSLVQNIRDLVEPAALVADAREDVAHGLPEPRSPVAHRHPGGDGQPAGLDNNDQFAPALRAFANPDMEPEQAFPALRGCPDDDQDALGFRLHPRLPVNSIRPDVEVAVRREIPALPTGLFLLPARRDTRDHARRQVWRVCPKDDDI